MTVNGIERIPSSSIRVGDMIIIHANQRVPADMVLLRTHDKTGSIFIRTDQLDGILHHILLPLQCTICLTHYC
jgi:P-type E1-E2 ATPase